MAWELYTSPEQPIVASAVSTGLSFDGDALGHGHKDTYEETKQRRGARFVIPLLVPEGVPTGDGRIFRPMSVTHRELPLPLMWQIKTGDGHDGSPVVGRIDSIERLPNGLGQARGVFDTGPYGQEAERMVREGFLWGVSADLDNFEAMREDPVDASMGDIHIYGNPHYWLDPANAKVMAANVLAGLKRLAPDKAAAFDANYAAFCREADERLASWSARMAKLKGLKVVTYHDSWPYFAARFGVTVAGHVEPKPGIPPSPAHLEALVKKMQAEGVRVILTESYYPRKGPDFLAARTGAKVVTAAVSAGGAKDVKTYFDVFDRVIAELEKAAAPSPFDALNTAGGCSKAAEACGR